MCFSIQNGKSEVAANEGVVKAMENALLPLSDRVRLCAKMLVAHKL